MRQWTDELSLRFLGPGAGGRGRWAAATVLLLLAGSYALTLVAGGTNSVAPHWFYLPILFAGVRFGLPGSVLTAALATVLVGPLAPADVEAGTAQATGDWVGRGVAFLVIGIAVPALVRRGADTVQQEYRDRTTEREVRRGLAQGEFVLHYQPVIDLDTGRITGAEALLRWQHPERGLLPPAEFIRDVERIGPIATWVLGEAAATAARWRLDHGLEDFVVAVNVSPQNLAQPDFVAQVRMALLAADLPAPNLCVEVTESAMIDDIEDIAARLQVLRSIGARVAIDDFGIGHATFAHLQQLPVDVIKVDRSFVADLETHRRGDAIVGSVVRLARDLGADCVAEGVETTVQLAALRAHGCHRAQGYLFARPLPAEEFEALLTRGVVVVPRT